MTDATLQQQPIDEEVSERRLWIGGLTQDVTEKELKERFRSFGKVISCNVPRSETNRPRGFAFVTLQVSNEELRKCVATYNNSKWKGGRVRIAEASKDYTARRECEREKQEETTTEKAKRRPAFNLDPFILKRKINEVIVRKEDVVNDESSIDGKRFWKRGRFGRAVTTMRLQTPTGERYVVDPSHYKHNLERLYLNARPTPINDLTWNLPDAIVPPRRQSTIETLESIKKQPQNNERKEERIPIQSSVAPSIKEIKAKSASAIYANDLHTDNKSTFAVFDQRYLNSEQDEDTYDFANVLGHASSKVSTPPTLFSSIALPSRPQIAVKPIAIKIDTPEIKGLSAADLAIRAQHSEFVRKNAMQERNEKAAVRHALVTQALRSANDVKGHIRFDDDNDDIHSASVMETTQYTADDNKEVISSNGKTSDSDNDNVDISEKSDNYRTSKDVTKEKNMALSVLTGMFGSSVTAKHHHEQNNTSKMNVHNSTTISVSRTSQLLSMARYDPMAENASTYEMHVDSHSEDKISNDHEASNNEVEDEKKQIKQTIGKRFNVSIDFRSVFKKGEIAPDVQSFSLFDNNIQMTPTTTSTPLSNPFLLQLAQKPITRAVPTEQLAAAGQRASAAAGSTGKGRTAPFATITPSFFLMLRGLDTLETRVFMRTESPQEIRIAFKEVKRQQSGVARKLHKDAIRKITKLQHRRV